VLPIGSIEPNAPREMHLACGLAFSGPLSAPLGALRRQWRKAAVGRIDQERRLALRLAVIAPVVSRFAEECVVRVSNARLSRKTRELLVGQGGPITEVDRPLERHSQHRDAWPIALEIRLAPRRARRRPMLTLDGDGCDDEGQDNQ
jgi:hypothetical protein